MADTDTQAAETIREAGRVMQICNACRYCEGYCAVFPAMERRLDFTSGDLKYLANLCHDCRECYYSCQYAPPHEFELNLPRVMAALRQQTIRQYAWPRALAGVLGNSGLAVVLAAVVIPAVFFLLMLSMNGPAAVFAPHADAEGAFYALLPHSTMAWAFGIVGLFVMLALLAGWRRYRRDIAGERGSGNGRSSWVAAVGDALRLRYLRGAGSGCAYPGERASDLRRRYHHLTFYGFMLCFAATCVAALYHYVFGWEAPYSFSSAPVVLGTAGGIGLVLGPAGLLHLKRIRDPQPAEPLQTPVDVSFLVLLLLTGLSGLLLLFLRERALMGIVLAVHLGLVMGLFLTLPYGKFVHALYRLAALIRHAEEENRA